MPQYLSRHRLVLAFILAPLAPAALIATATLFDGLDNGGFLRTAVLIALFGGYPATLLFGLPAFLILKRWVRPRLIWIVLVGGLVATAPVACSLASVRLPERATVDGVDTVQDGRLTAAGRSQNARLLEATFVLGALGGLTFWLAGVRRLGAAKA